MYRHKIRKLNTFVISDAWNMVDKINEMSDYIIFIFFFQQNAPKYRIYYIIMCLECMIFIIKMIIMVGTF